MTQLFNWRTPIEILVLACLIYSVLAFLRGSRGAGILRGLSMVMVVLFIVGLVLAQQLQLYVLSWLFRNIIGGVALALVIIFQPELRSALVRVGQSPLLTNFVRERWSVADEIAKATLILSRERTGALIAIQRSVGLKSYTDGGVQLDAEVSAELLISIFKTTTPLHDGGVVIRGDRIVAAACLFPLSENPDIDSTLGTRHRAALGVTEESDALVVVVSEETGAISIAENGTFRRHLNEKQLREELHAVASQEGFRSAQVAG